MPLPAHTSATFYVPAPGTPVTVHSFGIPATAFRARFRVSHHALGILRGSKLLAMAMDAGYGTRTDLDTLLRFTPAMRKQLRAYLTARWNVLTSLLEIDPVSEEVRTLPLVQYIESTEKGDAAFILGCLGSRYATAEWLHHRGQSLDHFWHFSVYADPAVSITLSDTESRPDYLAHAHSPHSGVEGHWYAVEAKGTLGRVDWGPLQTGMAQARLLKKFGYSDRYGDIRMATIDDCAVSLACFESRRLHIVHVDPPADKNETEAEARGGPSFLFNSDMVNLLNFYQGYHQFKSMTRQTGSGGITVVGGVEVYLGEFAINRLSQAEAWIAIPKFLYEHARVISDVLTALSTVTPAIGTFYRNAAARPGGEISVDEWNSWVIDQHRNDWQRDGRRTRANLIRRRIWRSMQIVDSLKTDTNQQVPSTPLEALNRVANASIITGAEADRYSFATIVGLRARLDEGVRGLAAMGLFLGILGGEADRQFSTLQGLLVMLRDPRTAE